tara:strand:- start:1 stop:264 length:264 start_codon:yes stop_codon:yes gene_type:complete
MEKIIFFAIAIPILAFVVYLGGSAIMSGFIAKSSKKDNEASEDIDHPENFQKNGDLSDELNKLNELLKNGVLTQEEFEKAKKKILDN